MFIEKIEIPAFRVLRDVVLDFSGGYEPQIFPIGSENGGGKSTLLQLIFVLLHCSTDPTRRVYLESLLASDARSTSEHVIARLTVKLDGESRVLEFLSLGGAFLERLTPVPPHGYETREDVEELKSELTDSQERLKRLDAAIARVKNPKRGQVDSELADIVRREFPGVKFSDLRKVESALLGRREECEKEIGQFVTEIEEVRSEVERITNLLVSLDYKHLVSRADRTRAVVCRSEGLCCLDVERVLGRVASTVFLLGPSNQQYLFLGTDTRKALLGATSSGKAGRPQIEYLEKLAEAEKNMTGFFAYDWLSVEPLLRLFASARDEDFKNVVKTGQYGTNYTVMLQELNGLLLGKKVRPLDDLSGIEFVVDDGAGNETALSPEDLSQGELKRLMIYAWLRANHAVDAVVLIDEIEASFHPDWQVGIVRDLQDWAPNNQYLLATHSYELCQALTPRHVRELQPRLRKVGTGDEETKPGPTE